MPPKLLIVVNVDWFFASHRLPVAIAAINNGFDVHLATTFTDDKYRKKFTENRIIVHDLQIDRSGKDLFKFFSAFLTLYSLFRRIKPDLLHLVTIQPVLIGGLAARLAGVNRVVYAISGLGHVFLESSFYSRIRRIVVKLAYRLSVSSTHKAVIFQNTNDLNTVKKVCSISSDECHLLCGSGVDLSLFQHTPLSQGTPVILMASRLLRTKGVYEFIEAASILKKRGLQADFVLAGESDFSNPAAVSVNEIKLWKSNNTVKVLGFWEDVSGLISSSHIVCLPSYYPEGLPKFLCEAASCGRVIVTTFEPGCRDAVENWNTGLLVPSRDALALANALQFLLLNPQLIVKMGASSRVRAERLFDLNLIVKQHLDIYSLLLSS